MEKIKYVDKPVYVDKIEEIMDSPRTAQAAAELGFSCSSITRPHEEHPAGVPSRSKPYALVRTPIVIKKAMQMPEAAKALEAEWTKLEDKQAWLLNKVKESHHGRSQEERQARSLWLIDGPMLREALRAGHRE